MPKRFTDTGKWQDEWFMDLPAKYKLFYLYLLDNCDHAGVWKVNLRLAEFHIGEQIFAEEIHELFAGRVIEFKQGYWFLVKFIKFQYGGIKNDAVGKSISKIIEINNLKGAMEGLTSPYVGTKVKYKVKDKDKVIEGGVGGDWESIKKSFLNAEQWMYKFCTSKGVSRDELFTRMQEFINDLELRNEYKDLKELQRHFTNWYNKTLKTKKNGNYFDRFSKATRGAHELLEELRAESQANFRSHETDPMQGFNSDPQAE